ncbi:hypothetical protein DSO57_1025893 [Entomophthora muscae]|uniref:Uncharacterized protein n=1 Tax=Entomophthora muscae TaxID=34485 RepID=A0ACC2UBU6_9FUNG|nr:hypothetical protein DSO57_1025893 [Entomophthora muscae]
MEFTLEEILIYNPEACTRETELISCEETWITMPPLLFFNKYNYMPVYLVPMTPPLTLRPNCPQESFATSKSTSTQIFGVMYITLTGLIDSILPTSRPWPILGKSISYISPSCGGPFLLGLQAVCLQVLRNLSQNRSLTSPLIQTKDAFENENLNVNLLIVAFIKYHNQLSNRGKKACHWPDKSDVCLGSQSEPVPEEGADQQAAPRNTTIELLLAVPKTVLVPFKLRLEKITTTAHLLSAEAKAMVTCHYLAQAHCISVLVDS